MMKKVMKTLLALAMAFVCGGAWAATPVAEWNGDLADNSTKNGYTMSNGGNATFSNGQATLARKEDVVTINKGLVVSWNAVPLKPYTVEFTYSGYSEGSGRHPIVSFVNPDDTTTTIYAPWNKANIDVCFNVTSTRNADPTAVAATNGQIPAAGTIRVTICPGNKRIILETKASDAQTFTLFKEWTAEDDTLWPMEGVKGVQIGGTEGGTNRYFRPALTITEVKIYDDMVTLEAEDVAYVGTVSGETVQELSALTWTTAAGESAEYSSIQDSDKIRIEGTGKFTLPTARTGKVVIAAGVSGVLPESDTVTVSTPITGGGALEKVGSGELTLTLSDTKVAGGLKVSQGTLATGAAESLHDNVIVVENGAYFNIDHDNTTSKHGYVVILNGGTVQSAGVGSAHGHLINQLILTAHSTMCNKPNTNSGYIGIGSYVVNSGTNTQNSFLSLNGHTLTITGRANDTRVYFDKTTITSAGTINVTKGRMFIHCAAINAPTGTKLIIGENAALIGDTHGITVDDLVYNSTASLNADKITATVNKNFYPGSGKIPKVTIGSNCVLHFAANAAENTAIALCTDTLSATSAENVIAYVGDNAILANLTYDTTNKTVSYEKVRDPGDIYYSSGYFNAGSAGAKPTLKTENAIETAYIPGDTVVVSDKAEVYFAPICFSSVKIASDVIFKSGEETESLDGTTFTISDSATLTLAEGASRRGLNLGDVTFNVTDGGKVVFSTSASANKISGNAPIELADGVNLTVSAELTDGRVVCAAKIAGALSTTYYKTVQAAIDAIGSGDVWNIVIVGEQTVPAGYYLVDNHLLKAPNVSVGFNGDCWTTSSVLSDGSTGRTKENMIDTGDRSSATDADTSFEAVRYSTTDKAVKISNTIRPVYEDANNGYFNGVVKRDASWTVSIVTKPKAVTNKKIAIWGMGGATYSSGKGIALLVDEDGKPEFISYNGTTPTTLISTPQSPDFAPLYDDTFHVITIAYNNAAMTDRWTMYVDGARVAGSDSAAALTDMGTMFVLGNIYGGAAVITDVAIAVDTLIDDVAAWNRALGADEVAAVASLYPIWPKFATATISDETLAVDASTLVDSGSANKLTINVGDNSTAEELEITVPSDLHLALLKIVGTRPVKLIASDDFVGIATLTITAATKIRYESESMVAFDGLQRGARTYEFKNASIGNYNDGTYKIHVCDGDSVLMLGNSTPKRNGESIEVEEGGTLTFNTSGVAGYWYGTGATTFLQKGGTVNVPLSGTNLSGNNDGLLLGYTSTGVTSALVQGGTFDASTTILKLFICPSFNISGGTVKVKGVSRGDSPNNNNLVLSGGTLELGSAGWQNVTFNLNGGTFKAVASSNMASPIIIGGQATIEVGEGQTLTISGAISGSANITKTGAGRLVISGSLEDYTGTITASDGVIAASDFSKISTADTGRRLLVESIAEYASGHFTVPAELESDDFEVLRPTGVIATKAEVLADTTAKISGFVTSFDVTYTNTLNAAYSNVTDFSSNSDGNNTCTYNNTLNDKSTAAYLQNQPHLKGLTNFYKNTSQLTFAIVGTMPSTPNTIFAHFGHSEINTTSGTGYGLLLITGKNKDEVVVAWNHGRQVNEITTMSVPNAATQRHTYIVTKNDTETTTTFTIYLDGQKWKTLTRDKFVIIGNVQLGGDFWGMIRYNATNNPSSPYKIATDGLVNCVRGYDRIISQAEISQYSAPEEYPYNPPNGASTRTFTSEGGSWITDEGNDGPWANTAQEEEHSVMGSAPIVGAAVTATLTANETSITINVDESGVTYETLTIGGMEGSAKFAKADGSGAIRASGLVSIYRPISVMPGSIDLSASKVKILENGSIDFDYTTFDLSTFTKTTIVQLVGDIDAEDVSKITVTMPAESSAYTVEKSHDTNNNRYIMTVTPKNPVATDEDGNAYTTVQSFVESAQVGKTLTIEDDQIPTKWTDEGSKYLFMNQSGKLEVASGAPANGMTSYESYVLQLNPTLSSSKPVVSAEQDSSATSITIVDNITVRDGKTATRKLKIGTTADNCAEVEADYNDGFTVDLPSGVDKVKFIKIEYVIQ